LSGRDPKSSQSKPRLHLADTMHVTRNL